MMYLDLAELDQVFAGRWLWSSSRRTIAEFRRSDHLGDPSEPLDVSVRRLLRDEGHDFSSGPIRLLTQLRYFGYVFNPVSFYFCFDAEEQLQSVVAEVNNTPWGERHCYVLEAKHFANGSDPRLIPKVFHVSPFMPMDQHYAWRLKTPTERLTMHMQNLKQGEAVFDVTMQMKRKPITRGSLAMQLMRFPLMTQKVIASIYWEALRLWIKGCPFIPHPSKAAASV